MVPFSGRRAMAFSTTGNQAAARKQLALPATSNATMNCTIKRRPNEARAKLATPPKLIGCQGGEVAGIPMVERLLLGVRPSTLRRLVFGGRRRVHGHDLEWETGLHHVVQQHFDVIKAGGGE